MAELNPPADGVAAEQVQQRARPARRLDIVGRRNIFFLISLIIIVPGIVSMVTRGFLLGIDFQGGTELFIRFHTQPTQQAVEAAVQQEGVNGIVQRTGQLGGDGHHPHVPDLQ